MPAKEISKALLAYALEKDDQLKRIHEKDRIDDKTVCCPANLSSRPRWTTPNLYLIKQG
jgi:hypothetical protein